MNTDIRMLFIDKNFLEIDPGEFFYLRTNDYHNNQKCIRVVTTKVNDKTINYYNLATQQYGFLRMDDIVRTQKDWTKHILSHGIETVYIFNIQKENNK